MGYDLSLKINTMKKLILSIHLVVTTVFAWSQVTTITRPTSQALLLDTITTIVHTLPKNATKVKAASLNSNIPMNGVFLMFLDANTGHTFKFLKFGDSLQFTPVTSSYQIAPLIVDWSSLSDNSGSILIEYKSTNSTRADTFATNQAVLLDNRTPILNSLLPGRQYRICVNLQGNTCPMNGVFLMANDQNFGHIFHYIESGDSIEFTPTTSTYQSCTFMVDWSSLSDNQGSFSVTYKLVGSSVGLVNNWESHKIQIFPNPTSDLLKIAGNTPIETAKIYSNDGQLVYSKNLHRATNASLALPKLSSGNYTIQLESEHEVVQSRLLISN